MLLGLFCMVLMLALLVCTGVYLLLYFNSIKPETGHDPFIAGIFYQVLEYIVAPMGLVVFTYYIKGTHKKQTVNEDVTSNPIENTFIASYSCLLYYFTLSAHMHKEHPCSMEQQAALLTVIAGLLILFIHKYLESNDAIKSAPLLDIIFKYMWVMIMFSLLLLIIISNMEIHDYIFTTPFGSEFCKDFWTLLIALLVFVIHPHHALFVVFTVVVSIVLYSISFNKVYPSIALIQGRQGASGTRVEAAKKIVNDPNAFPKVKVSSHMRIAEAFFEKKEYRASLESVIRAKDLACEQKYPEDQMYGIRVLKMRVHCKLGQRKEAENEMKEVQDARERDREEYHEYYDQWLVALKKILDDCGE
jgi:hypothetical protein